MTKEEQARVKIICEAALTLRTRRCAEIARTPKDVSLIEPGRDYIVNYEKGCYQRPKTAEEIEAEILREFPEAARKEEL